MSMKVPGVLNHNNQCFKQQHTVLRLWVMTDLMPWDCPSTPTWE